MGKTKKKQKENHTTKVTKIPKTKRQKYGMIKTYLFYWSLCRRPNPPGLEAVLSLLPVKYYPRNLKKYEQLAFLSNHTLFHEF